MQRLDRIQNGIEVELLKASESIKFRVKMHESEGMVWKVFVESGEGALRGAGGLDESLEGAKAWWPGPPKGMADVLTVIPEEDQINLRFANAQPPGPGGTIHVYPPRYLESLRVAWADAGWARKSLTWLDNIAAGCGMLDATRTLEPPPMRGLKLRHRQRDAFQLPGREFSFLWGPPGTGKTTTLGALLAAYANRFPNERVLLLSTTNLAVDQALVAVDKALAAWLSTDVAAIRKRLCQNLLRHAA